MWETIVNLGLVGQTILNPYDEPDIYHIFSLTILTQLCVNCAQYVCDFVLICVTSSKFNFVYISFCQLYARKPQSIYVQLRKSERTYALSRFLLRLTHLLEME